MHWRQGLTITCLVIPPIHERPPHANLAGLAALDDTQDEWIGSMTRDRPLAGVPSRVAARRLQLSATVRPLRPDASPATLREIQRLVAGLASTEGHSADL